MRYPVHSADRGNYRGLSGFQKLGGQVVTPNCARAIAPFAYAPCKYFDTVFYRCQKRNGLKATRVKKLLNNKYSWTVSYKTEYVCACQGFYQVWYQGIVKATV